MAVCISGAHRSKVLREKSSFNKNFSVKTDGLLVTKADEADASQDCLQLFKGQHY